MRNNPNILNKGIVNTVNAKKLQTIPIIAP